MYSKNDVALTPPMGWNSYDYYNTCVTEAQVRANALYMAENLREHGWEYIVIDIQWSDADAGTRDDVQYIPFSRFCIDEYSRQIPAPNRFPSSRDGAGFAPLAEYVHSLGLKLGIHIMRGIPRFACHEHLPIKTHDGRKITADMVANPASISKWNPDMYGVNADADGAQDYYDSIFELYASWGVDFVKVDDICNTNMYPNNPYSAEKEIEMIHKAISRCGRPMVLSLSPGPAVIEKAWHLEKYANMWRITDDFWDSWPLLKAMFERCEVWQNHVSPGCWPDCDMLPVGRISAYFKYFGSQEHTTNLTPDEQYTLMNLWCIFRSPLMIGAELTKLDDFTRTLLTNDEVLALTKNGAQARLVSRSEETAVWTTRATSPESIADFYVALFNLSDERREVSVSVPEVLQTLFAASSAPCASDANQSNANAATGAETLALPKETVTDLNIRDLWQHKETGTVKTDGVLSAELAPHASILVRITEER